MSNVFYLSIKKKKKSTKPHCLEHEEKKKKKAALLRWGMREYTELENPVVHKVGLANLIIAFFLPSLMRAGAFTDTGINNTSTQRLSLCEAEILK